MHFGLSQKVIVDSAASFGVAGTAAASTAVTGHPEEEHGSGAEVDKQLETLVNGDGAKAGKTTKEQVSRLLPVSANNDTSLQSRVRALQAYIHSRSAPLAGIAYTLGSRRQHLSHRTFVVARDGAGLPEFGQLQKASPSAPCVAFVFTGQGEQWFGMGKELIHNSPSFEADIRSMDMALQSLHDPPSWSIQGFLRCEQPEHLVHRAEYSQPLCTALQVALVNLLAKCGISPGAVVGHSSGEIAGAYAAGTITMAEAISVAYYRGLAAKSQARQGCMAAVGLGREAVSPLLADGAVVACENSPGSITISGDVEAVERTLELIKYKNPEALARKLSVDKAYHSHHMREVGQAYEASLLQKPILPEQPRVRFYSSLTGQRAEEDVLFGPAYWRQNLESPVLFRDAVEALLDDLGQSPLFLEVGPHGALREPVRQTVAGRSTENMAYITTLTRGSDCFVDTLAALGRLYAHGCDVNFAFLNPPAPVLTDLPAYPWDHSQKFWTEDRLTRAWRYKQERHHEMLGSRCLESSDIEVSWRNVLEASDVPWLGDHKIVNDIIFPCAGYVAMMGEAIRQTTGSESYTLRNMVVKAALMFEASETVELMTRMKPVRLTDSANSSWSDLSIMALRKGTWAEHCVAQGKAGQQKTLPRREPVHYPRRVGKASWYERLAQLGLKYGPRFRGMQRISSHTTETRAVAEIETETHAREARYAVHPTALDACLQLFTVSIARGLSRHMVTLCVPSAMGSISIKPADSRLKAEAVASATPRGGIKGDVAVVAGADDVVVQIQDAIFRPLDSPDSVEDSAPPSNARLEWRPDVDFVDLGSTIRRTTDKRKAKIWLQRVTALCILRALDALQSLDVPAGYLAKYVDWLRIEKRCMLDDEWAFMVPEARSWAELAPGSIETLMPAILGDFGSVWDPNTRRCTQLLLKMSTPDNIRAVFQDDMHPLNLMMEDSLLESIYTFHTDLRDTGELISLCAHAQPMMKVLEVGAGTATSTLNVLKALVSDDGTCMYSQYIFTDISAGFFAAAADKLRQYPNIDYKVFDIAKDPAKQGFEPASYDLILADNVVHVAPSLQEALRNLRLLLRPGGRLVLGELVHRATFKVTRFATGLLPGWWAGEADGRHDGPLVSAERWDDELRLAGFSGTGTVFLDDDSPYQVSFVMASTAVEARKADVGLSDVTFLYRGFKHEFALELAARLAQEGIDIHWSQIGSNEAIDGRDVVSTVDLEGPYLHDISKTDYDRLVAHLSKLTSSTLWLTRAAQVESVDPRYGLTIGLARTIRTELGLRFSTLELQSLGPDAVDASAAVFHKLRRPSPSAHLDAESEFVFHDGAVLIGRYRWVRSTDETQVEVRADFPSRLVVGRYGQVDSMRWVQYPRPALEAHEVELDVRCVGLNFRDLLLAMGIVDDRKDSMGVEAAGVIARVGSAVRHVKAGDRVMAIFNSCFSTRTAIPAQLVALIPEDLGFEDAATMSSSILVQSACGGVGLAALQICKTVGAQVYATVGSEEKIQHLVDNYGITRDRIFSSRDSSFLQGIMQATNGRGVDMVLNSLSGELLQAAWQCVAKHGKMMEIGKRDFIGRGQLMLDPFEANRSFYGVDLYTILTDRPELSCQLLNQCIRYYKEGHIKPIRPIQVFPAQRAADAFRIMQRGQHLGKLVISMPGLEETKQMTTTAFARPGAALSDNFTYFMVGGLGGLGKAVTRWMVERGARHFVFLSRSAGQTSEDQEFLQELESQGCHAVAVAGSVVEQADVERAIQAATTPIAGVVHLSMVLRDGPLFEIDHANWAHVTGPKVIGAWNIHNALANSKLDFFILFSSVAAAVGQPGQANYSAANSFLESFAQYRRGLDLPCSVISLGVMQDIGYISGSSRLRNQVRSTSSHIIQEGDLIEAMDIIIHQSRPSCASTGGPHAAYMYCNMGQLMVGLRSTKPLSDPGNRTIWKRDVRMSRYHRLEVADERGTGPQGNQLDMLLDSVALNPGVLCNPETLEVITWGIGRMCCQMMMWPKENLDVNMSIVTMGVDSLVSIEIRNWWRRTFGVETSTLKILGAGTIENLGAMALASLKEKHDVKEDLDQE
ncbi:hypothetical protein CDD83_5136 [Cordyceps sp. RAO-2017]|nr:hypothetical protein CDD83_5136 [Cordyceps sp. RAO-2017]